MPTSKTVRIQGTFQVIGQDGTPECTKNINSIIPVTEAAQVFPQTIAGLTSNASISFGGVSLAKRIFLRTNFPVTVKINSSSDVGFSVGVGDNILMSDNGITALYVSTGPNPTDIEAIIVG